MASVSPSVALLDVWFETLSSDYRVMFHFKVLQNTLKGLQETHYDVSQVVHITPTISKCSQIKHISQHLLGSVHHKTKKMSFKDCSVDQIMFPPATVTHRFQSDHQHCCLSEHEQDTLMFRRKMSDFWPAFPRKSWKKVIC